MEIQGSKMSMNENQEKDYDNSLKNYLREEILKPELDGLASERGDYLGMTGPKFVDATMGQSY